MPPFPATRPSPSFSRLGFASPRERALSLPGEAANDLQALCFWSDSPRYLPDPRRRIGIEHRPHVELLHVEGAGLADRRFFRLHPGERNPGRGLDVVDDRVDLLGRML